jgi:hypothetical protein
VQLASSPSGKPVVFETDETFLAVGMTLQKVQVFDGGRYSIVPVDQMKPGKSFAALSTQPQAGAALYLGFDAAFPTGQNRLTIHAAPPGKAPVVQVGPDLTGSALPPVLGYWEYFVGGTLPWQPLVVDSDRTNCLTHSGVVLFNVPGKQVASKVGALQKPTDALFWIRFRIDQLLGSGYESHPLLEDVLLNTVSATNAVTELDELVGASNGLPNQTFSLANAPILPRDPTTAGFIAVQEVAGGPFVNWNEVSDFGKSGPGNRDYTINRSTGIVTFGDGINGMIPPFVSGDNTNLFAADVPNILATSYRWGGGSAGNAGPNTITSLSNVIPYVDSVTNLRAASGGQDEETVDNAGSRAPALLRTQYRAVTAQDFADLAMGTPGAQIVRAHALPMHHPTLSVTRAPGTPGSPASSPTDVPFPGVVTVLVIPYSDDPKPLPSEATLQLVANQLDACRLATTEVYVCAPNFRKVEIQVSVIANPRFLLATVSQALNVRLLAYFHPVTGGEDNTGWGFGDGIYEYETLRQILLSTGVVRIVSGTLKTYVDDVLQTGDVDIGSSEIVYSVQHTITVSYS